MNCPGHAHLFGLQRWSYRDLPYRCAEPGPAAPPRAGRHAARADARAALLPGRRPHLLPRGPGRRGGRGLPGLRLRRLRGCSTCRRGWSSATRPEPDKRFGDDAFWDTPRGCSPTPWRARRPRVHGRRGRGRVLRAEDRPALHRLARPLLAARHRPGSTTTCPSASAWSTRARTTPPHRPVMIHRALFGSFERFIGVLLEHTAGELPEWLAPVQAVVLPIADRHVDGGARPPPRSCARPACASRSTTAPSRSAARSARPSCRRSPTCSSSATARRRTARSSVRRHREGDEGSVAVERAGANPRQRSSHRAIVRPR